MWAIALLQASGMDGILGMWEEWHEVETCCEPQEPAGEQFSRDLNYVKYHA